MEHKLVPINSIKPNPNNPRTIKDEKFKALVKSIKDFPKMLYMRPIVVDEDMIVLGGNMRLKACKEAGLKKVPIIYVDELNPEQKREFIIKDNVGFGDWSAEDLHENWDVTKLEEWGLDVPAFEKFDEEPVDLSDSITQQFKIEISCKNESDQEKIYNKLIAEGYDCKVLTL